MANEQEKSNLKDWKDVPAEYKWRAFDSFGFRTYFKWVPSPYNRSWECESGAWFKGGFGPARTDWRESLEQRPENL